MFYFISDNIYFIATTVNSSGRSGILKLHSNAYEKITSIIDIYKMDANIVKKFNYFYKKRRRALVNIFIAGVLDA